MENIAQNMRLRIGEMGRFGGVLRVMQFLGEFAHLYMSTHADFYLQFVRVIRVCTRYSE